MKRFITLLVIVSIITSCVTSNQKEEVARHDIITVSSTPQAKRLLRRRRRELKEESKLGKELIIGNFSGGGMMKKHLKGKKSKAKGSKDSKRRKCNKTKSKSDDHDSSKSKSDDHDCSQMPSTGTPDFPESSNFDLQDCATYDKTWSNDISESCYDTPGGCKCPTAKKLIDNGKIDCQVDRCPHDCVVCSFCLEDVLGCYDNQETSKPFSTPTTPTKTPVMSPIATPTATRTSAPSGLPSVPFDLSNCSTYSQRWLEDLGTTCFGDPELNAESCQCIDARSRIESGEILCDTAKCPDDCEVCKFCLDEVEGCTSTSTPSISPTVAKDLYDLSNCNDYSPVWRFELIVEGTCVSAQELANQGLLTCNSKCPDGCAACNLCLSIVLDGCD
jgi:hypothetical protein